MADIVVVQCVSLKTLGNFFTKNYEYIETKKTIDGITTELNETTGIQFSLQN